MRITGQNNTEETDPKRFSHNYTIKEHQDRFTSNTEIFNNGLRSLLEPRFTKSSREHSSEES